MGFWSRAPIAPDMPVERLKQLYNELGSLQAVADAEKLDVAWIGRRLKAYDRRVSGSDANYAGPERRGGERRRPEA
jgi:hypothetical protein